MCPTLVLGGDSDYWLGVGLLRGMEEVVERPEVHVLQGASHWIQQDKCAHEPFANPVLLVPRVAQRLC